MTKLELPHLQTWIGKEATVEEKISPIPARLMAATLDQATNYQPGMALPPAWHWLYFHEVAKTADLGHDGHAKRGGFLPPIPLPRRMWAGGKLHFIKPLIIGERVTKRSRIKDVQQKLGRSGSLIFVLVGHELRLDGDLCLEEDQTLVYRDAPRPGEKSQAKAAPTTAQWSRAIRPSPVLLFRYSALTFNSHRIHYDGDYSRQEEGYPGLVVHGPLLATLLLQLAADHAADKSILTFDYRAVSPLFDTAPFSLHGRRNSSQGQVWATSADGGLAMTAQLTFG